MGYIDTRKYRRLRIEDICDEGCLNILEMFLSYLSADFRAAYQMLVQNPLDKDVRQHYENIKNLFFSDYFSQLTNLDGNVIVEQLENECCRLYA